MSEVPSLQEQLELQSKQEEQLEDELQCFVDRVVQEYSVTRFQMAALFEQAKLKVLGFNQDLPGSGDVTSRDSFED